MNFLIFFFTNIPIVVTWTIRLIDNWDRKIKWEKSAAERSLWFYWTTESIWTLTQARSTIRMTFRLIESHFCLKRRCWFDFLTPCGAALYREGNTFKTVNALNYLLSLARRFLLVSYGQFFLSLEWSKHSRWFTEIEHRHYCITRRMLSRKISW